MLIVLAGCQSTPPPPPPLAAPPAAITATHFAGSPLSGPVARAVAIADPADALAVTATFTALEQPWAGVLDPLLTRARLITSSRGGAPIVPSGQATLAARVGTIDDPAALLAELDKHTRHVEMATTRAALPAGATAAFELADASQENRSFLQPRRRIEIEVHRPAPPANTPPANSPLVEFAVVVDELPLPSPTTQPAGASADGGQERSLHREIVILDAAPIDRQGQVAFILPFKLGGGATAGVLAIVRIEPGSRDADHVETCKLAADDLKAAFTRAAASPNALLTSDEAPSLQSALASLARGHRVRSALAFLAGQTGARLCEDVCLVADDAVLASLADAVLKAAPPTAAPDRSALGWTLDRAVLQLLSSLYADSKLAPELASVLAAHTGEVARHPASLEDVLKAARDRDDLGRRLIAENQIFLEDSSPAARVRAFDWLWARSRAPAGFDPLAPARERRLALQRAATAPTAP